jgi:type I restriction-modification system DNA methylase subunit
MVASLLKLKANNRPDNFQTPDWPVISFLNALPEPLDGTIWDPCCGKGNLVNLFIRMNQKAFGTDIESGYNFLKDLEIPSHDYIITNPPYSLKDKFIARCYELGKPWSLLMPITALGEQKRYKMFKEHGIQVGLLPRRVNFETPSGEGAGAHFTVAWFSWGFGFPNDITYLEG